MWSPGYLFVVILMIASKGLGTSIPPQDAGPTRRSWPVVPGPWPSQSQGNVDSNSLPSLNPLSGYGSVPSVGVSSMGFGSSSDSLTLPSVPYGSSVNYAGLHALPQYLSSSHTHGLPPVGFGMSSSSLGFPRYGVGSVRSEISPLSPIRYGAKYGPQPYEYESQLRLPGLPPLPLSPSLPIRGTLYNPLTVSDSSSVYDSLSSSPGSIYSPYSSSISRPLYSSESLSSNGLTKGCYPRLISSLCNLSEISKRSSDSSNAAASLRLGFEQDDSPARSQKN